MHLLRFILIPTLFLTAHVSGQQTFSFTNIAGKIFVSKKLEYLKVLNDTTLYSSINSYNDTANFFLRNDTLFIKQKYLQTDQTGTKWVNKLYNYKIVSLSDDTLKLKNRFYAYYMPDDWEDTLLFVTIDKLKEPVADFKYLKLDFLSPWSGKRVITIDSLGKVIFVDRPIPYSKDNPGADRNAKPKNIKGQLTQREFTKFKNLLSVSLPSKLPLKRGCPMDGATSNFEILIGTKKIISKGCDLSWTHSFLLNYLYEIDINKDLKKTK